MKRYVIGFLAGALFATVGTATASGVLERVTATVRTDYTVELDGKQVTLVNSPLAYNGASYLPVREVSEMLDKEVDFKDGVIILETPIADPNAELQRLEGNKQMLENNLTIIRQSLLEAESDDQIKLIENSIRATKDSITLIENKISRLKERYPDLNE